MDFWQGYVVLISTLALMWAMKEVYEMVTVRKLWQSILHDPEIGGEAAANLILGLMGKLSIHEGMTKKEVAAVEANQALFFNFINTCFVSGMMAVQNAFGGEGGLTDQAREKAMKGLPKSVKTVIRVADLIGINLKELAGNASQKVAEEGTEAVIDHFGK